MLAGNWFLNIYLPSSSPQNELNSLNAMNGHDKSYIHQINTITRSGVNKY